MLHLITLGKRSQQLGTRVAFKVAEVTYLSVPEALGHICIGTSAGSSIILVSWEWGCIKTCDIGGSSYLSATFWSAGVLKSGFVFCFPFIPLKGKFLCFVPAASCVKLESGLEIVGAVSSIRKAEGDCAICSNYCPLICRMYRIK